MYAKKVWNVNIFYYFPIMKHLGFFLYGRPIVHILMKLMVDTMKNTRIMVLTYGSLNAEFAHELLHI